MGKTSIEWTNAVWNPTRGCSRVSEGCRHCYAERIAGRFSGRGQRFEGFAKGGPHDYHGQSGKGRTNGTWRWTGRVELIPDKLLEPLHWRKPRRVFVNSMSDLFHEALPDEAIDRVFAVMSLAKEHAFQILTKRPERMRRYVTAHGREELLDRIDDAAGEIGACHANLSGWPLPNVWLGVSVEDQATADERIPLLLQTPAAVRWVSYEPALEPVDFRRWVGGPDEDGACQRCGLAWDEDDVTHECPRGFTTPRLSWIVVGGESGPGARPFDLAWARSTVAQCRAAGVPVFVKQLGAKPRQRAHNGTGGWLKLRDRKGGDMAEWPQDLRVREFPREFP